MRIPKSAFGPTPWSAFALTLLCGTVHAQATAPAIELAPAEVVALGIEVTPVAQSNTIAVDGLVGDVELPLAGTSVIATPYAGRIVRVDADEGERVTRGQVLAIIDSRDYAHDRARLMELDSRATLAATQASREAVLAREGIIARSRAAASAATAHETRVAREALAAVLHSVAGADDGRALASFELRAPADGIVVQREVMPGERVDAQAAAFVIAESTAWRVSVQVPVALGPRLGPDARLRIGEFDIPVSGRGLALDAQTQTVRVRGRLPPDNGYVPGQRIVASLHVPAPVGALTVPRSALMHHGEVAQVFHASGRDFRALPVTILGENASTAVIEGPLVAGDDVVSSGVGALKSLLAR